MSNGITFKLFLNTKKQTANGEYPIYLRITKNRKYRLKSTGITVDKKHWNANTSKVRRSHVNYASINKRLDTFIIEAEQTALNVPEEQQNLNGVKKALSGTDRTDFFTYANEFLIVLKNDKRLWALKHTAVTIGFFKRYIGKEKVQFDEITHETLHGFQNYLRDVKNQKPNTINKHFQGIKRVFNKALLDEIASFDPFTKFKPVSRVRSEKTRLSYDQIQSIANVDTKSGTWHDVAKDTFLFSFYNAGIRFGDIARLKWCHVVDGRLKYNMAKTGTGKNILLLKPALEILEKYRPEEPEPNAFIFPILKPEYDYSDEMFLKRQISSKNFIVNKSLKSICESAGIQANVSFHVSRHSFADFARSKNMSVYDISKALGHSDITITQVYLKSFDETSLDNSMKQIFE